MSIPTKSNLYTASREWATRPDDQRFLTLADLRASVAARTDRSRTDIRALRGEVIADIDATDGEETLVLRTPETDLSFTNWSFGQYARECGAPPAYLTKLPAKLALANLRWGVGKIDPEDKGSLFYDSGSDQLRAITSPTYGRIYDLDIVEAVQRLNADTGDRWVVPASSQGTTPTKKSTTLYASDRDVFLFLVDDKHPIQLPGQQKPSYRGFIVSNSEVGSASFKMTTFLYETVCDNRIIWGSTDVRTLSIRHTSGAPERFLREAAPQLLDYANATAEAEIKKIERAQNIRLQAEANSNNFDDLIGWVSKKTGIGRGTVREAARFAEAEEGQFDTAWDAVQGLTAFARSITHTNTRIEMEAKAATLLR